MNERREDAPPFGIDDELRYLIRQQRRVILEARTIAITLQSAVHQIERVDASLSLEDRIVLRRQWCERASALLLDVRAHAARIDALTHHAALRLASPQQRRQMLRLRDAMSTAGEVITAAADALDAAREQRSA